MSSIGYRMMVLEQRQRQRLQQALVRRQAQSLLKQCQRQIQRIKDPGLRQFAAGTLNSIERQLDSIAGQLDASPEMALANIRREQTRLNDTLARIEVEAERRRMAQLRQEAGDQLTSAQAIMRGISDPSIQQMTAASLRQIQQQMREVSTQIQSDPQAAKKATAKLQKQLQEVLADAEAHVEKNARRKAQAQAQLQKVQQDLDAQEESTNGAAAETLQKARQAFSEAQSHYREGQYDKVAEACQAAVEMIEQAGEQTFDESVRREVVSGLLSTLGGMGFVVAPPQLHGDQTATNVVKLTGRMPSGRTASFQVSLDGKMQFDFDGYEGRACAKDLEAIDRTLHERFAIKAGPAQITWKNPDKIARGVRSMPTGHTNTHRN